MERWYGGPGPVLPLSEPSSAQDCRTLIGDFVWATFGAMELGNSTFWCSVKIAFLPCDLGLGDGVSAVMMTGLQFDPPPPPNTSHAPVCPLLRVLTCRTACVVPPRLHTPPLARATGGVPSVTFWNAGVALVVCRSARPGCGHAGASSTSLFLGPRDGRRKKRLWGASGIGLRARGWGGGRHFHPNCF